MQCVKTIYYQFGVAQQSLNYAYRTELFVLMLACLPEFVHLPENDRIWAKLYAEATFQDT